MATSGRTISGLSALLTVITLVLGLAGCNKNSSSSELTTPSPGDPTVEMFTGTVSPGSIDWHPFSVTNGNGVINVTLTAAGPPATIYMGLGVGTATDTDCTLFTSGQTLTQAGSAPQLSGTAGAGKFCVAVFDVGNQVADVMYSVTVSRY
jgi:hypothetical protein